MDDYEVSTPRNPAAYYSPPAGSNGPKSSRRIEDATPYRDVEHSGHRHHSTRHHHVQQSGSRRRHDVDDDEFFRVNQNHPPSASGRSAGLSSRGEREKDSPAAGLSKPSFVLRVLSALFLSCAVCFLAFGAMLPQSRPWYYARHQWHPLSREVQNDVVLWDDDTLFRYTVPPLSALGANGTYNTGLVIGTMSSDSTLRFRVYAVRGLSVLGILLAIAAVVATIVITLCRRTVLLPTILSFMAAFCNTGAWMAAHFTFTTWIWHELTYCDVLCPPSRVFAYACEGSLGPGYFLAFIAVLLSSAAVIMYAVSHYLQRPQRRSSWQRLPPTDPQTNQHQSASRGIDLDIDQDYVNEDDFEQIVEEDEETTATSDIVVRKPQLAHRRETNTHSKATEPPQHSRELDPIEWEEMLERPQTSQRHRRPINSEVRPHPEEEVRPQNPAADPDRWRSPRRRRGTPPPTQLETKNTIDDDFEQVYSASEASDVLPIQPTSRRAGQNNPQTSRKPQRTPEVDNRSRSPGKPFPLPDEPKDANFDEPQTVVREFPHRALGQQQELHPSPATMAPSALQRHQSERKTKALYVDPDIDDWEEVPDENLGHVFYSPTANLYLDPENGRVYDGDDGQWYNVE